jgi:hypothetical protein
MTNHASLSAFRNGLTLSMADAPMAGSCMRQSISYRNGDTYHASDFAFRALQRMTCLSMEGIDFVS